MKILRIGDVHAQPSNLQECEALLSFSLEIARKEPVNRIEILGDLLHNNAIVRVECIEFWEKWLDKLSNEFETIALEGNHDQTSDVNAEYSAVSVFRLLNKPTLHIVSRPLESDLFGYLPYMHDSEKFISAANDLAAKGVTVLVAHQTILGSTYDSGFYAKDGIDSEKISPNIKHIICGHIHTAQRFGRVEYPGTARWMGLTDANQKKGIWIYDHNDVTGDVQNRTMFPTNSVCSPLYKLSYKEGEAEPALHPGRIALELIGSSDWVATQREKFKGQCSISSKILDTKKLESRKTGKSFAEFLENIFPTTMDRKELLKQAKEIGLVG